MCWVWMLCGHKLSAAYIFTWHKETQETKSQVLYIRLQFSQWIQEAQVNLA